jgi:hypothetical protein
MIWTVNRDAATGNIHVTYEGKITLQDVIEATDKAYLIAEGDGPHLFLTDFVDVISTLRIDELFWLPEHWDKLGFSRRNKLAIVVKESDKIYQDVRFHVVTARSRGWQVIMCDDKETALSWLIGK